MPRLIRFLNENVDIVVVVVVAVVILTVFLVSRKKKLPQGLPILAAILGIVGIFIVTKKTRRKVLAQIARQEAEIAAMKAEAARMKDELGVSESELKRIEGELDEARAAHARTMLELEEKTKANRDRVEKLSDVEAIKELASRLAAMKEGG